MESANTLGLVVILALVYVATLCGGADSVDGPESPEWEQPRHRRGFGRVEGRPG
jgi:hypothetical protein